MGKHGVEGMMVDLDIIADALKAAQDERNPIEARGIRLAINLISIRLRKTYPAFNWDAFEKASEGY